MKLEGYTVRDVTPPEDASGGKVVSCAAAACAASLQYSGVAGWYTLHVQYFDQMDGISHYRVLINGQPIDEWTAAERLPTRTIDSSSSTRRLIAGIALRPGDEIRVEGKPDDRETAALDYIEILPAGK
jgi:alpha-glucuronidase